MSKTMIQGSFTLTQNGALGGDYLVSEPQVQVAGEVRRISIEILRRSCYCTLTRLKFMNMNFIRNLMG